MATNKYDVIIIGAGAAGLTAAHHLHKANLSIKILEASDRIGGRLRKDDSNLTEENFPLDLGGGHGYMAILNEFSKRY